MARRDPLNPPAEQFAHVQAAYEVLADGALRQQYDSQGLGALGPKYDGLRRYLTGPGQQEGSGAGGGGGGPGGARGPDVHTVLGLLLSEAVTGADKELSYSALGRCGRCQGSGQASAPPACSVCRGTGAVLRSRWAGEAEGVYGGMRVVARAACPSCGGSGAVAQPPCPDCRGRGRRRESRRLPVRVPAGVERGTLLRLAGEGSVGRRGGPAGDLLVMVEVYPDAQLSRRG
ncbi:hypothetical protein HYH03_018176, partial [Edaphochlamys debaryana]